MRQTKKITKWCEEAQAYIDSRKPIEITGLTVYFDTKRDCYCFAGTNNIPVGIFLAPDNMLVQGEYPDPLEAFRYVMQEWIKSDRHLHMPTPDPYKAIISKDGERWEVTVRILELTEGQFSVDEIWCMLGKDE